MTTVLVPPPVSAAAPSTAPGRTPKSSWFVRITIAVVVLDFRGRYVMFVGVVALMVVPLQMARIPVLRV
jgi:hypothetical protein